MSGYSDDYKDMQYAAHLREWAPENQSFGAVDAQNLRHWVARARKAEAEVKAYRDAIAAVKKTFGL